MAMMAAGTVAVGGAYRHASAQAAKRIERLDPALDEIIATSEPIVDIATNLGGTANVEGPLWWKEGGYLLFRGTDLKRWKYAPGQPISVNQIGFERGIHVVGVISSACATRS